MSSRSDPSPPEGVGLGGLPLPLPFLVGVDVVVGAGTGAWVRYEVVARGEVGTWTPGGGATPALEGLTVGIVLWSTVGTDVSAAVGVVPTSLVQGV